MQYSTQLIEVVNTYRYDFRLIRVETRTEDHDVDIFNIIQKVQDTSIHLEVDETAELISRILEQNNKCKDSVCGIWGLWMRIRIRYCGDRGFCLHEVAEKGKRPSPTVS